MAEEYLVEVFSDSNASAINAKRATIKTKDIDLAVRLFTNSEGL